MSFADLKLLVEHHANPHIREKSDKTYVFRRSVYDTLVMDALADKNLISTGLEHVFFSEHRENLKKDFLDKISFLNELSVEPGRELLPPIIIVSYGFSLFYRVIAGQNGEINAEYVKGFLLCNEFKIRVALAFLDNDNLEERLKRFLLSKIKDCESEINRVCDFLKEFPPNPEIPVLALRKRLDKMLQPGDFGKRSS